MRHAPALRGLHDDKRISIGAAEGELYAGEVGGESLGEAMEGGALAVGMQDADHGEPGGGGVEGVVVFEFAGEVELRVLCDRLLKQRSAGTRGAGGDGHRAGGWAGDKEVVQAQGAADLFNQSGAVGWWQFSDATHAGAIGRGAELDEIERGLFVRVAQA